MKDRWAIVRVANRIALLGVISSGLSLGSSPGQKSAQEPQEVRPERVAKRSQPGTIQLTPRVRYRRIQPDFRVRQLLSRVRLAEKSTPAKAQPGAEREVQGHSIVILDALGSMSFGVFMRNSDGVACTSSPRATIGGASAVDPKGGRQ